MAIYAIGDVHACLPALNALLSELDFCPDRDRLWFVGDLINRGPESLKTLRFVRSLGDRAVVVMGNHEGRAVAGLSGWDDPGLALFLFELKNSADAVELETWLRNIPLFHYDETLGIGMVHAGLSPSWTQEEVCRLSNRLNQIFLDPQQSRLFFQESSHFSLVEEPSRDKEMDHLRFAFSIMTRIRMCTQEGSPLWPNHPLLAGLANPYAFANMANMPSSFFPWFELRPKEERLNIVYGHWAAAGLMLKRKTWGLDSGCVYGGQLSAIRLDHPDHAIFQVPCQQYALPEAP